MFERMFASRCRFCHSIKDTKISRGQQLSGAQFFLRIMRAKTGEESWEFWRSSEGINRRFRIFGRSLKSLEILGESYKSLKISNGLWSCPLETSEDFGAFCVCVQRLLKSSEACACVRKRM